MPCTIVQVLADANATRVLRDGVFARGGVTRTLTRTLTLTQSLALTRWTSRGPTTS